MHICWKNLLYYTSLQGDLFDLGKANQIRDLFYLKKHCVLLSQHNLKSQFQRDFKGNEQIKFFDKNRCIKKREITPFELDTHPILIT